MEFKWIIRFLDTAEAFTAFDYQNDQIILYIGMYSIPSYVVWWIAPDKTKNLGIGTKFELILSAGEKKFGYYNTYIVENIIFDVRKQKYRLYALAVPHQKLELATRIRSLMLSENRDEPVSGYDFIVALMEQLSPEIEVVGIKPITDRIKYLQISLDPYTSVLDLITKICSENQWEYYLSGTKLFIGDIVKFEKAQVLEKDQDVDHKKTSHHPFLSHHVIGSKGAEPGMMYGTEGRVLWVKYYFSISKGTLASVMVTPFTDLRINEKSYITTLQEEALALGRIRLNKLLTAQSIILGRKYGDVSDEHLSNYEMPEFSGDPLNPSKDLRTYEFKTEYNPREAHFKYVQNSKITTPYAGDGVGLLFPQTTGNHVLFSPEGERDMALIGPAYYGRDEEVPRKNHAKDFRFQLPDNSAIYYDSVNHALYIAPDGTLVLQEGGMQSNQIIPESNTYFISIADGIITLSNGAGDVKLELSNNDLEIIANQASIKVDKTTNKISLKTAPGYNEFGNQVIIDGTLVVNGQCQASAFKTQIVANYDAAIMKKIPPGP